MSSRTLPYPLPDLPYLRTYRISRLKALAKRKRVRKKEREAAARLRSRVAMGMENSNTAVDLPVEEGIFSLASIKVRTMRHGGGDPLFIWSSEYIYQCRRAAESGAGIGICSSLETRLRLFCGAQDSDSQLEGLGEISSEG